MEETWEAADMTHPLLYQVNTRAFLRELGEAAGRPVTLDDVPDAFLDEARARGFDWIWFLGVWQTGPIGRAVSRTSQALRPHYADSLPDVAEEDIVGSPFAIQSYTVSGNFGGDAALARLRSRMARRDLRLLLDFVPNHLAPDHPWVETHPERLVAGTEAELTARPADFNRFGGRVLAHGRDPYFPGWPDTVQLDYRRPETRAAMMDVLDSVADRCDGVRCDMAMLVETDVFLRTWGGQWEGPPFWPEALTRVRTRHPGFLFMAEVYWDLEYRLQQHGFDFTYDKRLYDRLVAGEAAGVRGHLQADPGFQERSARFLENHDEPRAASTFPPDVHPAAAVISFLVPGLRFFHEGQFEGWRRHLSMHLGRRAREPVVASVRAFYEGLLAVLRRAEVHEGSWRQHWPVPAWEGNPTHDQFVGFSWEGPGDRRLLVVVNYGPSRGQCYLPVAFTGARDGVAHLRDLLGPARYERRVDALARPGLYLDLPAWGHHAFEVMAAG